MWFTRGMTKWTRFMDMHSGGGTKEPPYDKILIEAPEDEARRIFYARFGHNPDRVTCTCCGEDYSIDEHGTLDEATAYDRGLIFVTPDWATMRDRVTLTPEQRAEADKLSRYLEWDEDMPDGYVSSFGVYRKPISVDAYLTKPNVLIIRADEIADAERSVDVPSQGYVWIGDD
jgi:hypothetical protein